MNGAFQQYNPFRSPRWRADRVRELLSTPGGRPGADDDTYVRQYFKFLQRWAAQDGMPERQSLFPRNPGLFYAQVMDEFDDPELVAVAEAAILARESPATVAQRIGAMPQAIEWYERLFFHVTDRLNAPNWIVKTIAGPIGEVPGVVTSAHALARKQAITYKTFAYCGGSQAFDAIAIGFNLECLPSSSLTINDWYDATFRSLIKAKATEAAKFFEMNRYNVMQTMELNISLMNHEHNVRQAGGMAGSSDADFTDAVDEMSYAIPWQLAQEEKILQHPLLQKYNEGAIEPRASEHLRLALGYEPEELRQTFDAKFGVVSVEDAD